MWPLLRHFFRQLFKQSVPPISSPSSYDFLSFTLTLKVHASSSAKADFRLTWKIRLYGGETIMQLFPRKNRALTLNFFVINFVNQYPTDSYIVNDRSRYGIPLPSSRPPFLEGVAAFGTGRWLRRMPVTTGQQPRPGDEGRCAGPLVHKNQEGLIQRLLRPYAPRHCSGLD